MSNPNFGIDIFKVDDEPRPVLAPDLSTIGLIGPAPDADVDFYPENTPVKIYSYDTSAIAKLGAGGYLQDAVRALNDQLADAQFAVVIVVVRTPVGTNADAALKTQETIAHIMGDSSMGTGLSAFIGAADAVGVTPRLIIAPGYTGQMANGVDHVTVGTAGSGYDPDNPPVVTFSGGGSNATIVQATGHAIVSPGGTITGVVLDTPGQWFTAAPAVAIAAPTSGVTALATAVIETLANPVVAGLPGVLDQLLGHAIVESSGIDEQGDDDWRETIQSQRIIGIVGGCKVIDPVSGFVVTKPLAPRIAGIAVRRDHETGAPFHSWANQPVYGIVGPARNIKFALTDGANEGQQLIGANLGVLVRGEVGNDFAIASGGFVFIGTDNLGEDELWRFYNQTRGRDYIHLALIRSLRYYLGRENITAHTVQKILNQITYFLRDLQADENILGFRVNFDGSVNSPEQIRAGHLTVGFRAEEPAPLKRLTLQSARYRDAVVAMVEGLEQALNFATAA